MYERKVPTAVTYSTWLWARRLCKTMVLGLAAGGALAVAAGTGCGGDPPDSLFDGSTPPVPDGTTPGDGACVGIACTNVEAGKPGCVFRRD